MHFDGTITLGNLLTIGVFLWPVIRFTMQTRDFPLHRHVNGKIFYPKGMAPGEGHKDQ